MELRNFLSVAVVILLGLTAFAQDYPKIEVAVDYSYARYNPSHADVKNGHSLNGAGGSVTFNFNKYMGIKAELTGYGSNSQTFVVPAGNALCPSGCTLAANGNLFTYLFGPQVGLRSGKFRPFGQVLFGGAHSNLYTNLYQAAGIANSNPAGNTFAMVFGGGVDIPINHSGSIAIRPGEIDYLYTRFNNSVTGAQSSLRYQAGVVFNFGGAPEVPVAAACSVQNPEVMVGEPVHANVVPSNFNPKHPLTYTWSSTGGKIEGKDAGATIDTTGAAPGSYVATARVSDPKRKKGGEASCTSNFTVKPLNPPQISCSASPSTVEVGTSSTITCTCTSPDNATVTVGGWTSTAGSVSVRGNSATLTTTGASAGPATVNATCTDSRGLTASTSSSVTVNNPPPPSPPPAPPELRIHSVYFVTAKPTEKEPTAGLLKSQEQTLVTLATNFKKYLEVVPDAHLTLEGHADVRGTVPYNEALSERRVARVKSFLVENGVPEANIETKAFGEQHNLTADEVKAAVEQNPELTTEERTRVLRNMKTIVWASNRRVDITLNAPGQATETSVQQYPFNAADSLTLIGGREAERKAAAAKKGTTKKPAKKQ